jgi:type I restriction enzyme M protein
MRFKPLGDLTKSEWFIHSKAKRLAKQEPLRQWVLHQFAESYFYPRTFLVERTLLFSGSNESPWVPKGFFGFCLTTDRGDPFLWVSLGDPGGAEAKLREVLNACPFARLGLSTDGSLQGTRCIRQRSASDKSDIVPDIEVFVLPDRLRLHPPFQAPNGKRGSHSELEPISSSLENVFFEAHSHIRDIDGFHADEALDELCKVLYAKLYDEELTKAGDPYSLQRGLTGTAEEFAAIIRRTYRDANEYDVRVFSLKIPGYDRSRGVFNSDIRLSTPALVKVVETIEPYWLTRSSIDVKGRAFQKVLGPSIRAGMGQYFTPQEVIRLMVDTVGPSVTDLVMDPFSGSGHFLTRCLDEVRSGTKKSDEKRLNEFAFNKLHGI